MVSVTVNASAFGKKFQRMLDLPKFKQKAYEKMESHFEKSKHRMMSDFNKHPVTREIEGGPLAGNTSNLLGGYGNLFSFIGFYSNEQPIEELRDYLDNSITLTQTVRRGNNWYFRVGVPTREGLEAVTPMPWEPGNSWADGIEHGISNLSHYLYVHWDKSRSEEGVQLKHEFRPDAEFQTMPYMTKILNDFRERFD